MYTDDTTVWHSRKALQSGTPQSIIVGSGPLHNTPHNGNGCGFFKDNSNTLLILTVSLIC